MLSPTGIDTSTLGVETAPSQWRKVHTNPTEYVIKFPGASMLSPTGIDTSTLGAETAPSQWRKTF